MNQYVKKWGNYKPSTYTNALGKTYFKDSAKKMKYTIKSISVKGKSATVKVRVKYINCQNIYD